jgi:hypothetical protein
VRDRSYARVIAERVQPGRTVRLRAVESTALLERLRAYVKIVQEPYPGRGPEGLDDATLTRELYAPSDGGSRGSRPQSKNAHDDNAKRVAPPWLGLRPRAYLEVSMDITPVVRIGGAALATLLAAIIAGLFLKDDAPRFLLAIIALTLFLLLRVLLPWPLPEPGDLRVRLFRVDASGVSVGYRGAPARFYAWEAIIEVGWVPGEDHVVRTRVGTFLLQQTRGRGRRELRELLERAAFYNARMGGGGPAGPM